MTNIYILKLEHNKYYIGKTNNVNKRLNDHMSNNGSQWTKKYKPITPLKISA
jgi:predicted GIY-YIG superfamily endonuclease